MAVNAKFKHPDGQGGYETFHFETNASQVQGLGQKISEGLAPISEQATGVRAMQTKIENYLIGPTPIPTQKGSLVYDGNVKAPAWYNFDPIKMTIGGATSATNAGTYQATFVPNELTTWDDGTTVTKTVSWTIIKAAPSLSASVEEVTLDDDHLTKTFTVNTNSDGAITVSSSNASKVTASIADGVVTLTAQGRSDNEEITITVGETTNYKAEIITIPVTVDIAIPLADCTPEEIQKIIKAGRAASMWQVGDSVPVHLQGTIQGMSVNDDFKIMILGIDHNASLEGSNRVHFVIGKNKNGVDIAFCTPDYYTNGGSATPTNVSKSFIMNPGSYTSTTDYNRGGWAGSVMHNRIMPQWKALLPEAWQKIISPVMKYTDNYGNNTNLASSVTGVLDEFFLMSEFEVQGARTYANSYEQNYQRQYAYYANGNSKVRYNHSNPTQAVRWWLRGPRASYTAHFCIVLTGGSANDRISSWSLGVTPCFTVA